MVQGQWGLKAIAGSGIAQSPAIAVSITPTAPWAMSILDYSPTSMTI